MKKLLTTITLSALVGTSASNLKPVFTNNFINHGFKSNQLNNKEINIENENDINPFTPKKLISGIPNNVAIRIVNVASNGTVYVGSKVSAINKVIKDNWNKMNNFSRQSLKTCLKSFREIG